MTESEILALYVAKVKPYLVTAITALVGTSTDYKTRVELLRVVLISCLGDLYSLQSFANPDLTKTESAEEFFRTYLEDLKRIERYQKVIEALKSQ